MSFDKVVSIYFTSPLVISVLAACIGSLATQAYFFRTNARDPSLRVSILTGSYSVSVFFWLFIGLSLIFCYIVFVGSRTTAYTAWGVQLVFGTTVLGSATIVGLTTALVWKNGPDHVLKYLARYSHRVAISNQRLLSQSDGKVRFRYKDYARGNRHRIMELHTIEFIRRFLLHVLPRGFVRIRHYGLLANASRAVKLPICRALLGVTPYDTHESDKPVDPDPANEEDSLPLCPECKQGRLTSRLLLPESRFLSHHRQPVGIDSS